MAGQAVNTLLLSQKDLIEAGVMDMPHCVDVIEDVFSLIGKGDYLMGGPLENEHGQMIYFPKEENERNGSLSRNRNDNESINDDGHARKHADFFSFYFNRIVNRCMCIFRLSLSSK